MAEMFKFEIYTPYRLFYSQDVQCVIVTIADGDIGIYAHHSIFTAPVKTCAMRIKGRNGEWLDVFVAEGVIEVKKNKTVLLVDSANFPEEIDIERVRLAKEKAESIIKDKSFKYESQQAQKDLRRAEVRLALFEKLKKQ
ncbi:MAG: F0F1 ATP synthase subunit epsilon [Termitinemataceae bacterium]|nr:MAG: F0F1 ATP synthase subunit epsilon [Termitinemataceae bacterium]